jgi:rubrerythrin
MLAKEPIDFSKIDKNNMDKQILRWGIIAELDAINFYEQLASNALDENIKKVLMDIANEEKEHVGEFQTLLLEKDKEQIKALEKGKEEVEELIK